MEVLSGDDCFRKLDEPYYILFYFTASWCGPCQRVYPQLVKLMETYDKNIIQCFKIDIDDDENQELCEKLKIKSVPTFILLKDRNYIDQWLIILRMVLTWFLIRVYNFHDTFFLILNYVF
tara:strand:- start:1188 stop:1547 length:360 start_codon:yes stop_codon:yes gene_type:complete